MDYLLHDAAKKPRLVVEAKSLGASLDKHGYVSKVLGYALGFKVQTVFITDGLNWHCYSNLHKGNTEATTFTLAQDNLLYAALQLVQWLDAAHSGHGLGSPASPTAQPTATPLAVPTTQKLKQPVLRIERPSESSKEEFVELTQIKTLQLKSDQKPKKLRLPDGTVVPLKTWKDILVHSSLFVLEHNKQVVVPYSDKAGKKKFLLDWHKPAAGIGYKETSLNGQALFIYTNYSASDCVSNALHALTLVPAALQKVSPAVSF
ncbi:hypothetical protein GCM10027346_35400 [Hymenobacter seoulensis]